MPLAALELLSNPALAHGHFDANPRAKLALDLADVACVRAEALALGGDDTGDADLERRAPRRHFMHLIRERGCEVYLW